MLPGRYLDEMGHTLQSSWKGNISKLLQEVKALKTIYRKSETMFTPFIYPEEYTLRAESIAESDSHCSTSSEGLDDSEDEDECQGKLY